MTTAAADAPESTIDPGVRLIDVGVVTEREASTALLPEEAARFLGVMPKTLSNWRAQGRGPAYVLYGQRKSAYLIADLIAYRETHRIVPERGDAA